MFQMLNYSASLLHSAGVGAKTWQTRRVELLEKGKRDLPFAIDTWALDCQVFGMTEL